MRILFLLLFSASSLISCAQSLSDSISAINKKLINTEQEAQQLLSKLETLKLRKIQRDLSQLGIPASKKENVIYHSAMALEYSEEHEQAKWVAHIILPDIVEINAARTNDFRPDLSISTGSAVQEDYFLTDTLANGKVSYVGFGFDRGHLAPSADFRWSKKALSESYMYSNMSPQRSDFNREIWADLEVFLRSYVIENEAPSFITTGPVLNVPLPKLERSVNKISIPEFYFKTVIDLRNRRGVAFLLKNEATDYPVESFAISIDSLERLTGLDFYHQLPDSLEGFLEGQGSISPFQAKEKERDVAPINWQQLPADVINSVMAKYQINNGKTVRVAGKVVSATKSGNGHVFLNLDQSFPEQIFSISIFKSNLVNFSYSPEVELVGKTIVVRGKVGEYQGIPSMSIKDESKIEDFNL